MEVERIKGPKVDPPRSARQIAWELTLLELEEQQVEKDALEALNRGSYELVMEDWRCRFKMKSTRRRDPDRFKEGDVLFERFIGSHKVFRGERVRGRSRSKFCWRLTHEPTGALKLLVPSAGEGVPMKMAKQLAELCVLQIEGKAN